MDKSIDTPGKYTFLPEIVVIAGVFGIHMLVSSMCIGTTTKSQI